MFPQDHSIDMIPRQQVADQKYYQNIFYLIYRRMHSNNSEESHHLFYDEHRVAFS